MQIYMKEKKDWSLNGCLWIKKEDVIAKDSHSKQYLSNYDISDELIPREFKKHWHKVPKSPQTI